MCDCDCDPPTFYESKLVKARKAHKCSECLRVIEKGEQHEYAKGLWEGDFSDFRTCSTCLAMIAECRIKCYCHGQLLEELDYRFLPGVKSILDFRQRRIDNYERLRKEKIGSK